MISLQLECCKASRRLSKSVSVIGFCPRYMWLAYSLDAVKLHIEWQNWYQLSNDAQDIVWLDYTLDAVKLHVDGLQRYQLSNYALYIVWLAYSLDAVEPRID